jgi:hypothetical protein
MADTRYAMILQMCADAGVSTASFQLLERSGMSTKQVRIALAVGRRIALERDQDLPFVEVDEVDSALSN